MKNFIKVCLGVFLFMCFLVEESYTQSATLTIENAQVSGGYYYFEIHITPTDDWGSGGIYNKKALGDCSWYFNFNSSALSSPSLTYTSDRVPSSQGYTNSTGITGGKVYVDTDLDRDNYTGAGLDLNQGANYHIYTVRMNIDNPAQEADVTWDQTNTSIWNAANQPVTETYSGNGDISLPVQMTNILATANQKEGVTLTWRTESESDCSGFHVWRGEAKEGQYLCVTTALIPGQGNTSSAHAYSFTDKNVKSGVQYWYQIQEVRTDGTSQFYESISVVGIRPIPDEFALCQNYPNPFNPQTTIKYQLAEDGKAVIVVYNLLGKLVKELVNEDKEAGYYSVVWDGNDQMGSQVASGVYILFLNAGTFTKAQKVMLVR